MCACVYYNVFFFCVPPPLFFFSFYYVRILYTPSHPPTMTREHYGRCKGPKIDRWPPPPPPPPTTGASRRSHGGIYTLPAGGRDDRTGPVMERSLVGVPAVFLYLYVPILRTPIDLFYCAYYV